MVVYNHTLQRNAVNSPHHVPVLFQRSFDLGMFSINGTVVVFTVIHNILIFHLCLRLQSLHYFYKCTPIEID